MPMSKYSATIAPPCGSMSAAGAGELPVARRLGVLLVLGGYPPVEGEAQHVACQARGSGIDQRHGECLSR